MKILPVQFEMAPASSEWHWLSKPEEDFSLFYMLGLSDRFQASNGQEATMTMMPDAVKVVKEEIPENFDLVPGPDDMEFIDENSFEANGVLWIHGESGESCNQTCDQVGTSFPEPDLKWSKNMNFCQNAFNTLSPGLLQGGAASSVLPGLGCFTLDQLPNVVTVDIAIGARNADLSAEGVRQFCACKQD